MLNSSGACTYIKLSRFRENLICFSLNLSLFLSLFLFHFNFHPYIQRCYLFTQTHSLKTHTHFRQTSTAYTSIGACLMLSTQNTHIRGRLASALPWLLSLPIFIQSIYSHWICFLFQIYFFLILYVCSLWLWSLHRHITFPLVWWYPSLSTRRRWMVLRFDVS